MNKRVLVVDTDPQANATLGLGCSSGYTGEEISIMYTCHTMVQVRTRHGSLMSLSEQHPG